jgi:hypothetical protein
MFECEVGDLVKVEHPVRNQHRWMGVCTWTDGYKYSFFVCASGKEETWHFSDLTVVRAEVIEK